MSPADFVLKHGRNIGLGQERCWLEIYPSSMESVVLILDDLLAMMPLSPVNILVTLCSSLSKELRGS